MMGACFTPDAESMCEFSPKLPTSFITSTSSGNGVDTFDPNATENDNDANPPRRGISFLFRRCSNDFDTDLQLLLPKPNPFPRNAASSSRKSDLPKVSLFRRRHSQPASSNYEGIEHLDSSNLPPWHSSFLPIITEVVNEQQSSTPSSSDVSSTHRVNSQQHPSVTDSSEFLPQPNVTPPPAAVVQEELNVRFICHKPNDCNNTTGTKRLDALNITTRDEEETDEVQPIAKAKRRVSICLDENECENENDEPTRRPRKSLSRPRSHLQPPTRRVSISTTDDPIFQRRRSTTRQPSPTPQRRASISNPESARPRVRRLPMRGNDEETRPCARRLSMRGNDEETRPRTRRLSLRGNDEEAGPLPSRLRRHFSGRVDQNQQRRYTESDTSVQIHRTRSFFSLRRRRRRNTHSAATSDPSPRETFARSRNLALIFRTNASAGCGMLVLDAFQKALVFANDTRGLGRLLRALCATLPENTTGIHRDSLWRAADIAANFTCSERHVRPLPLYASSTVFVAHAPFGDALALVAVAASAHGSVGVRKLVRRSARSRRLIVSLTLRNGNSSIRIDIAERKAGAERVVITIANGNVGVRSKRRDLVASLRGSLAYLGIHGIETKSNDYINSGEQ